MAKSRPQEYHQRMERVLLIMPALNEIGLSKNLVKNIVFDILAAEILVKSKVFDISAAEVLVLDLVFDILAA